MIRITIVWAFPCSNSRAQHTYIKLVSIFSQYIIACQYYSVNEYYPENNRTKNNPHLIGAKKKKKKKKKKKEKKRKKKLIQSSFWPELYQHLF